MRNRRLVLTHSLLLLFFLAAPRAWGAGGAPDDDSIAFWVDEALRADPRVLDTQITVAVDEGIVTLAGRAWTLAEKQYAVREAQKIRGVRGVIDRVDVEPAFQSDPDIQASIMRRIAESDAIRSKGISVTVNEGAVDLEGTVDSWSEWQEAKDLASDVQGVRRVDDHLRVTYESKRPDDAIRADVLAALHRNVFLTDLPIDVTVENGVVTLTGAVGNLYEKNLAGEEALLTANVDNVWNNLSISWLETMGAQNGDEKPAGTDLAAEVQDEFSQDFRMTAPSRIQVTAENAHVVLRGEVPTYFEKMTADEDAKDVTGVAWVTNDLRVVPEKRPDEQIRDDLVFELSTDYALGDKDIEVLVDNGVVTLSGDVLNSFEKAHAEEIASHIQGVKDIVDRLAVSGKARPSDDTVQAEIGKRLATDWETSPVADSILVSVHDGNVLLKGSVNNWSQFREAERVAFLTHGVWAVENRIRVPGFDDLRSDWYSSGPSEDWYAYYRERRLGPTRAN